MAATMPATMQLGWVTKGASERSGTRVTKWLYIPFQIDEYGSQMENLLTYGNNALNCTGFLIG